MGTQRTKNGAVVACDRRLSTVPHHATGEVVGNLRSVGDDYVMLLDVERRNILRRDVAQTGIGGNEVVAKQMSVVNERYSLCDDVVLGEEIARGADHA